MASPLVRVSIKAQQVLDILAKRDGRSKGTIIEEALQMYYDKHKTPRAPLPSKRGRPKKEIDDA